MATDLILARKDRDKLGERHEQFLKGDVTSFVCVAVMADGTTQVDFDLIDAQDLRVHNKMGGGLMSAIDHLRNLALETKMKADLLRGAPAGHG
jgi:hypothetical protein